MKTGIGLQLKSAPRPGTFGSKTGNEKDEGDVKRKKKRKKRKKMFFCENLKMSLTGPGNKRTFCICSPRRDMDPGKHPHKPCAEQARSADRRGANG